MPLPRLSLAFAGAILAACAAEPPPAARPPASPALLEAVQRQKAHYCNAQTAAFLQQVGITPERITWLSYGPQISSGESARIVGIDAYVGLSDAPDAVLIVRQTPGCAVRGAYARGGARVPGL